VVVVDSHVQGYGQKQQEHTLVSHYPDCSANTPGTVQFSDWGQTPNLGTSQRAKDS
jgi:hypothetical protein